MKSLLFVILLCISFPSFAEDTRWIDLEWEEVKDAREYQIELFQQEEDKILPRGKYKTDSAQWSHAVTPGKYFLRLRSVDKRGVPGEWSQNIPLKVRMQNPQLLRPLPGDKLTDPQVTFEWTAIQGAAQYQLVVKNQDGKVLHNAVTQELKSSVYLEDLGKVHWAAFALEQNEETKNVTELADSSFKTFIRSGTTLDAPVVALSLKDKVSIEWKKVNLAQVYQLDYFPPTESGDKNRRFNLKKSPMTFAASKLKDGITTITVKAVSAGHQDSRKSIIKISKQGNKVELEDLIQGKEEEGLKVSATETFFRNELYLGVVLSKFSYESKNSETDTSLNQESLSGLGLMAEWNQRPTLNAMNRKLEVSVMNLSSGVESGLANRLAYSWHKETKTKPTMFSYGAGLSVLMLPAYMGNRFTDDVEVESSTSVGPEFHVGVSSIFNKVWEGDAGIVASYHPFYLSSRADSGDAYLWLKALVRVKRYYTEKQAFFAQLDYQNWEQKWGDDSSALSGFVVTLGIKNGF